jgi:rod shape determining protein RodA
MTQSTGIESPIFRPSHLRESLFLVPALGATLFGVYVLMGAEPDYLQRILLWQKQLLFAVLGIGLAFLFSRIPIPKLVLAAPWLYGINLILLLLVFAPGVGFEKSGARSWIDLKLFTFQPSEPMKLLCILLMARILQCEKGGTVGFWKVLAALLVAAFPSFLIAKQPDLGSALIFPPILLAALYGARVPRRYLALVLSPLWALVVLLGGPFAWTAWISGVGLWLVLLGLKGETKGRLIAFLLVQILIVLAVSNVMRPLWEKGLRPHQRDRLVGFLNRDEPDTQKMSPAQYHLHQSLVAISSGGMFGQGHGEGLQSSHGFIPMMRTDSIFAVVAEELGFVGSILLISLLGGLLWIGISTAASAATWTESAVVFGVLGLWSAHIFVNLGMTMGLCPITGIPLPFVSYGGTAVLSNFVALGCVFSVYRNSKRLAALKSAGSM